MSVNISVPEELYRKACEIAAAQNRSVDEVFSSAFAGQMEEWERLKARASRGDRGKFLEVLNRVPDVEAEDFDRL